MTYEMRFYTIVVHLQFPTYLQPLGWGWEAKRLTMPKIPLKLNMRNFYQSYIVALFQSFLGLKIQNVSAGKIFCRFQVK